MLRRLWPNARKFGLMTVGACAIANSGVLISGNLLGPEITASYGLTAAVGTFLTSISTLWLVVKWPALTILRTQGKAREMSVIFARRLALTLAPVLVEGAYSSWFTIRRGFRGQALTFGEFCRAVLYRRAQKPV